MTRFARAKGSKASNEKLPEKATPWSQMKQQLLEKANEEVFRKNKAKSDSEKMLNYKKFLSEHESNENKKTKWAEFPGVKKNVAKLKPGRNKVKQKMLLCLKENAAKETFSWKETKELKKRATNGKNVGKTKKTAGGKTAKNTTKNPELESNNSDNETDEEFDKLKMQIDNVLDEMEENDELDNGNSESDEMLQDSENEASDGDKEDSDSEELEDDNRVTLDRKKQDIAKYSGSKEIGLDEKTESEIDQNEEGSEEEMCQDSNSDEEESNGDNTEESDDEAPNEISSKVEQPDIKVKKQKQKKQPLKIDVRPNKRKNTSPIETNNNEKRNKKTNKNSQKTQKTNDDGQKNLKITKDGQKKQKINNDGQKNQKTNKKTKIDQKKNTEVSGELDEAAKRKVEKKKQKRLRQLEKKKLKKAQLKEQKQKELQEKGSTGETKFGASKKLVTLNIPAKKDLPVTKNIQKNNTTEKNSQQKTEVSQEDVKNEENTKDKKKQKKGKQKVTSQNGVESEEDKKDKKKKKKDKYANMDRPKTWRINDKIVDIDYVDGFPVKKEDAERLGKLKKEMVAKGLPGSEIKRAMKLERRRAEKLLAREKRKVCFNCRKSGHNLSECPQVGNETPLMEMWVGTGICFKCGSTEHTHFQCKVVRTDQYQYATCFICKEQGHISRQCPDNPRGLYPKGGACNVCGDITHLKKDCPTYQAQKQQQEQGVMVETMQVTANPDDLNDTGGGKMGPIITAKNKIIKF